MLTGLFTVHFANGRYAISIIATYYIEIKKKIIALEIAERPSGKFQGKNQSQIFDQIVSVVLQWAKPKNHRAKISHKKYWWFCGERHRKTTATQRKVSLVLPLIKPMNDSKNSIGGFSVTSTDGE